MVREVSIFIICCVDFRQRRRCPDIGASDAVAPLLRFAGRSSTPDRESNLQKQADGQVDAIGGLYAARFFCGAANMDVVAPSADTALFCRPIFNSVAEW